jgi:PelA/Pel-15E family pectate lyase
MRTRILWLCGLILAVLSSPTQAVALNQTTSLRTISLIMGEPNFAMDGGYQELEEGLYTQPELKPGKKMFAPLQDIIGVLGGTYRFDASRQRAEYELAGHRISLQAGQLSAEADGQPAQTDIAPELRGQRLWVSLPWFFEQLGAWVKWEDARQRVSATLLLPRSQKTEDVTHGGPVQERNMTDQAPEFYASAAGRQLADVVVAYQNADGGWPKLDFDANMLTPINTAHLSGLKIKSTIDNDSTTKQLTVLARVYRHSQEPRYLAAFNRGLDYLLAAQLANGGWQQFWPAPLGYKQRITFNDDAMANVLEIMRDITLQSADFRFVDTARRERARQSFSKGLNLILRTQLVVGGKKTGWCAQYDERTLAPAAGRAFELASISGHESVNVLRFLMSLEQPSPELINAVQDGVRWLAAAALPGQRRIKREDRTLEAGFDYVLVKDASAPAIWARFYDLDEGRALFAARDGRPRSDFAEVPYERRVKYNWFTEAPRELLSQEYPRWQRRWAPHSNVLPAGTFDTAR